MCEVKEKKISKNLVPALAIPAIFGCPIICCGIPGNIVIILGGKVFGSSNPLSLLVISLQAIENSLKSNWPSPLTSAKPLEYGQ